MKKKRGYEYEMMLARIDAQNAAIRISNLSLSASSGYTTKLGIGFCGLGICAIRQKKQEPDRQPELPMMTHEMY